MRTLNKIVIHCSDTPADMDIGASEIRRWHLERGWSDIGYHFVARRDGGIDLGRDVARKGAHVKGHNSDSIGICLVGGRGGFNFTKIQIQQTDELIDRLEARYGKMEVLGHRDFPGVKKECPCYDVKSWRMEA